MAIFLTILGWVALGIGLFTVGTSLVLLIVAFCTQDKAERHKNFVFAGKFFLVGLLIFAIGFGSCAVLFT